MVTDMIIVTGGAGFVGSNIIKNLNYKGIFDILVVDNLKDSTKITNLADLNIKDYVDKKDFLIMIKKRKKIGNIKAILHNGACSNTTEQNGSYMINNNYQYSKNLLQYCIERRISFIYASSAAVYGKNTTNFIESRKYEHPLNVYGYSKFLFDEYVRQILPKTQSQIVGLRYFNVYGPREGHKGNMASVAYQFNTQLNNNESIKLFRGSENFKRDFVYIDDVVSVNLWFLKRRKLSGIFNLGTGYTESFQTIAYAVIDYHKRGNIEYIPFPNKLKNSYQKFTQANLDKLRIIGYNKPFKNITKGIKKYMIWLNQNSRNS